MIAPLSKTSPKLTRGHYERALDAYHRALGRSSVTEYYKVYSTPWIVMYARAMGLRPDAFALRYLGEREGALWLHDLARWATGKTTSDQLLHKADTRGKRAEAFFYEALASYGKGGRDQAEKCFTTTPTTPSTGTRYGTAR